MMQLAKGFFNKIGQRVQSMNARDWRERMIENLPFTMDDTCIINLPEKFDPLAFR